MLLLDGVLVLAPSTLFVFHHGLGGILLKGHVILNKTEPSKAVGKGIFGSRLSR